ncbi:MAG: hypothetical protein VB135_00245 [Burkholderia sp.]
MSKPTITYHTRSADGCLLTTQYDPFHSSSNYKEVSKGSWWPHYPEAETISAEMVLKWPGGRRHELVIDGDQHRELESEGLLPELFARFADGEDPDAALEEVLEQTAAPKP